MHICACLHTLWQDWRAGQSKTRTRLLTVKVKTSQSLSHVCLDCSPQGFSACGSLQAGRAPAGQASVRMAIFIWRLLGSHRHSSPDQPLGLLSQCSDSRPWGSWALACKPQHGHPISSPRDACVHPQMSLPLLPEEGHAVGFPRDVLVQTALSRDQAHVAFTRPELAPPLHVALPISELAGQARVAIPFASMSGKGGCGTVVPSSTRGSSSQDLRGLGSGPRWVLDVLLGRTGEGTLVLSGRSRSGDQALGLWTPQQVHLGLGSGSVP